MSMDDFAKIFGFERKELTTSEEYENFIQSMVAHCRCRTRDCPCDGVLAGGICDDIQDEQPSPEDEP